MTTSTTTMLTTNGDDQLVCPPLTVPGLLSGDRSLLPPRSDGTIVPGGLPIRKPINTNATQKLRGQAAVVPRTGDSLTLPSCILLLNSPCQFTYIIIT